MRTITTSVVESTVVLNTPSPAKRKRDELKGPEAYRATDDELFARCRLVSSTEDEQDAPANDDAGVDHADDKRWRRE